MNSLPANSKLEKLLLSCGDHEIIIREHVDGAISVICESCPFTHPCTLEEEKFVKHQIDMEDAKVENFQN